MNIWEADKLYIFIMFVIPGFIALKSYELIHPSESKDSSKQIVDAIAFSCLNYGLLLYFILKVEISDLRATEPNLYALFYFAVLFIIPVVLVFTWSWLRRTELFLRFIPHPTGKPWDEVFSQRKVYWLKVGLKDGTVIAGHYGGKSFASSAPWPEQIYLEETWILNDKGGFVRKKNRSAGVIILSGEISYVEFKSQGEDDAEKKHTHE